MSQAYSVIVKTSLPRKTVNCNSGLTKLHVHHLRENGGHESETWAIYSLTSNVKKITTDIVYKLSFLQLKELGLQNRSQIMALRIKGNSFGSQEPRCSGMLLT